MLPLAIVLFALAAIIWLFFNHGIDKLRHLEKWKDAGKSGEQIVYRTFVDKYHVPENQILRNVYIPTSDGKSSEIDLLVVSKKGLLVFECKNYGGNIYGDAKRPKWIQYLGRKKSYFYNPLMQNRTHVRHMKKYLEEFGDFAGYSNGSDNYAWQLESKESSVRRLYARRKLSYERYFV